MNKAELVEALAQHYDGSKTEASRALNAVVQTITRTTAPLGRYTTGFITLTGPTRVRMPVAIKPLSVEAPYEVAGSGVTGATEIEIVPGFTGQLDVTTRVALFGQLASRATGQGDGRFGPDRAPAPEGSGADPTE